MSHQVNCTGCGKALEIPSLAQPGADQPAWIVCPHCQARNVNPAALQQDWPLHPQWLAVLGVLIVLTGVLGCVLGTPLVALDELFRAAGREGAFTLRVVSSIVGFVALTAAGFLMIRAATHHPRQADRVGKVVLAITGSVGLALAGIIYAFADCMGR